MRRSPMPRPGADRQRHFQLWLGAVCIPGIVGFPGSVRASDLFEPFLQGVPPAILRTLPSPTAAELPAGVALQRLVFKSVEVEGMTNEVYAMIARPTRQGPHPGLLLLHGGQGGAPETDAILWAQRGYIALGLDIPGIANPTLATSSAGAWRFRPYNAMAWTVTPTPASSVIYDATAACLQGFELLRNQADVVPNQVGILGWSWGGYLTAQISGLLGERVAAAFSYYGSGFYEDTWFGAYLSRMQPDDRALWLETFDAGRRAPSIRAPFFIAAAANDTFFQPPAIERTLAAIPGETRVVYAPNADHQLWIPGGSGMGHGDFLASIWFDSHLRHTTSSYPQVEWEPSTRQGVVAFRVTSPRRVLTASLLYSHPTYPESWTERPWYQAEATSMGDGRFEAKLPPAAQTTGAAWFALISDDRPVSVSSRMRITGRDLDPTYFLHEDLSGRLPGSRLPGWAGEALVGAETGSQPRNLALAIPPSVDSRETSISLQIPQTSPSGVELTFRIRPESDSQDWSTRWQLLGALPSAPSLGRDGYTFVLRRDSLTIQRAGTGAALGSTHTLPAPIPEGRWSTMTFRWRPMGDVEFLANGETTSFEHDAAVTGPISFQTLAITTQGIGRPEELLFDDIFVGPIPAAIAAATPQLARLGTATYSPVTDQTTAVHHFTALPKTTYRVDFSEDLASGTWIPLGVHQADFNGRLAVPFSVAGDRSAGWSSAGFFRITRLAP